MADDPAWLKAQFDENTAEVPLVLLTFAHPSQAAPQRFVANTHDVISRGNVYMAAMFKARFPDDVADEAVQTTLQVSNVDRRIVAELRGLRPEPTVTLELVGSSDPDTVRRGPLNFELKSTQYDALMIEGTLGFEELLNRPYPDGAYTPRLFPQLFRGV